MKEGTTQPGYTLSENAAEDVTIPDGGISSRTFFEDDQVKVILFGFAEGEELSEHSTPRAALLHFLKGRVLLGLGGDRQEVGPGALVHMQPSVPHSIRAVTPAAMLLILFKHAA